MQRATCNVQTCNLQSTTCNLQPTTCNMQHATFTATSIRSAYGCMSHRACRMPARCSVYCGAGNYLVQKLIDYATLEQRVLILQHSAADLVSISLNTHGRYSFPYTRPPRTTPLPFPCSTTQHRLAHANGTGECGTGTRAAQKLVDTIESQQQVRHSPARPLAPRPCAFLPSMPPRAVSSRP